MAVTDVELIHRIGDTLDRLISLDVTARGVVSQLYSRARNIHGTPLTSTAALALSKAIQPGDPVLIVTGFPSRSWLIEGLTETDGPAGAAVLARALEEALEAIPIIVCEHRVRHFCEAALNAAGLLVVDLPTALRSKPEPPTAACAAVLELSSDPGTAANQVEEYLRSLNPAAVVAIEMPGRARDGRHYNVSGREIPPHLVARGDLLFEAAAEHSILTVGIGDGGNELGMGRLAEAVARVVPRGDKVACIVPSEVTVAASISNWGAYGVAAAVAAVAEMPELAEHLPAERAIEACAHLGAIDGLTARPAPMEDGVGLQHTRAILGLMHLTVQRGLSGWIKG